jgi:ribosome-binding ATPase YchF (GTP1/OBG family)
MLKDLESVEKRLDKARKASKGGDKEREARRRCCEALEAALDTGQPATRCPSSSTRTTCAPARSSGSHAQAHVLRVQREGGAAGQGTPIRWWRRCASTRPKRGVPVVVISAAIEAEIMPAPRGGARATSSPASAARAGPHTLIRTGYAMLDLITYFTAGEKEVRAWTIQPGTKAPGAAGKIHTDFERGFIRAEVMALRRLVTRLKGEARRQDRRQAAPRGQGVRRAGRRRDALPLQRREDAHASALAGFIARHARPTCEAVIIDAGRGYSGRFSKRMVELGFAYTPSRTSTIASGGAPYRGQIMHFVRGDRATR